ncbi:cupin domain-containing protein, partial [Aeromonas veronii]|nr:cupin domain-containing protein [Aeromonas veronii]
QFSYVMKGSFQFTIEGEQTTVSQGETIFIPGNHKHGVVALEEGILLDAFTPLREDLLNR